MFSTGVLAQDSTIHNATTLTDSILSSGSVDLGAWTDAYEKAVAFVAQLTNNEKISVITGNSVASVNWTALQFKDGTQGVQGT